jgi:hypothetical protein
LAKLEEYFLEESAALADEAEDQWRVPEPVAQAEPKPAAFSDSSWPDFEAPDNDFEPDNIERSEVELRVSQVIGEEGVRSSLRARLVREEISYVHPELTAWRKLASAIRNFWQRFS